MSGLLDGLRRQAKTPQDGYLRWDGMAMELEYAEFMYSLVVALKPSVVVEAGAGRGITSAFIGTALLHNGDGKLYSYEPLVDFRLQAQRLLAGLPVEVRDGDTRDWLGPWPDLLFLDSGPSTRKAEIDFWFDPDGAPSSTVIVVHDANRDYGLPAGLLLPGGDGLWVGRTAN